MTLHARRAAFALQKLAEEDPTLGALALWCGHRDAPDGHVNGSGDSDLPAWTEGETIHYAPAFEDLMPHEQVGLAAHHVLHVSFRHAPRARGMQLRFGDRFQRDAYNIAADAIVNETLLRAGYGLPRPAVSLKPLLQRVGVSDAVVEEALQRLDTDALYVMLMHDQTSHAFGKEAQGEGSGKRAERVRKSAETLGFAPDLVEAVGEDAYDSSSQKEADWRQRLTKAFDEGQRVERGLGALGFRLADLPEVSTPWQTVLRNLVTKALQQERHPDYRQPSRRWLALDGAARQDATIAPVFQPRSGQDHYLPRIVIAVDSSGSIDAERLHMFAAQVASLVRKARAEVHLLIFDDAVRARYRLDGRGLEEALSAMAFSRDGGTSFIEVLEEAAALFPSVIVVLTDLDGPLPARAPACPVVWAAPQLVVPSAPFGRVISLGR